MQQYIECTKYFAKSEVRLVVTLGLTEWYCSTNAMWTTDRIVAIVADNLPECRIRNASCNFAEKQRTQDATQGALGTTYESGKSLPNSCASTGGNEHPRQHVGSVLGIKQVP